MDTPLHPNPAPSTAPLLTIHALARQCGVSVHTLRFYERSGILNPIGRDARGHRRYQPGDVAWLAFVLRLKRTGMPLAGIRLYAALRTAGESTLAARLDLLHAHRTRLNEQITELTRNAAALDHKISLYEAQLNKVQPKTPR